MAVGTYKLPICDGCKLPWLPVGWTQDSDPRHLAEGAKPLRCGKCKTIGWDREHMKEMKKIEEIVNDQISAVANGTDEIAAEAAVLVAKSMGITLRAKRCRHRLTDCSICHPKEAA